MEIEATSIIEQIQVSHNCDTEKFKGKDLDATVVVHLCALRNELNEGDENGEPPTNHWTMCLQVSSASHVMLDMAPGYGSDGLRGKIEMTSTIDRPYTDESLCVFSYQPSKAITVKDIAQLIVKNGRAEFNFSPEWEGCRFWMSVIMRDLEDASLIEKGSAATAMEAVL